MRNGGNLTLPLTAYCTSRDKGLDGQTGDGKWREMRLAVRRRHLELRFPRAEAFSIIAKSSFVHSLTFSSSSCHACHVLPKHAGSRLARDRRGRGEEVDEEDDAHSFINSADGDGILRSAPKQKLPKSYYGAGAAAIWSTNNGTIPAGNSSGHRGG